MKKPTERFTDVVENYLKYRPSYPKEMLQVLENECGLTKNSVIADIGSGTGFLSKLFLEHGNTVYGVEPNLAMREAGEEYLKNYPHFHSIDGTAENTTLMSHRVDFITAGTAFHWFDAKKARQEFKRVLKSPGWVLLVWNVRDMESELIKDYEEICVQYGKDYKDSRAQEFNKTALADFFMPFEMREKSIRYNQFFDWEGFKGRLLSASYSVQPGEPGYEKMIAVLHQIFERHQKNGRIEFLYSTKMYYGHM